MNTCLCVARAAALTLSFTTSPAECKDFSCSTTAAVGFSKDLAGNWHPSRVDNLQFSLKELRKDNNFLGLVSESEKPYIAPEYRLYEFKELGATQALQYCSEQTLPNGLPPADGRDFTPVISCPADPRASNLTDGMLQRGVLAFDLNFRFEIYFRGGYLSKEGMPSVLAIGRCDAF